MHNIGNSVELQYTVVATRIRRKTNKVIFFKVNDKHRYTVVDIEINRNIFQDDVGQLCTDVYTICVSIRDRRLLLTYEYISYPVHLLVTREEIYVFV